MFIIILDNPFRAALCDMTRIEIFSLVQILRISAQVCTDDILRESCKYFTDKKQVFLEDEGFVTLYNLSVTELILIEKVMSIFSGLGTPVRDVRDQISYAREISDKETSSR